MGQELKSLRKEVLGIRQDQFASVLGLHPTTVSDWERSKKENAVPRYAIVIANLMAKDAELCRQLVREAREEKPKEGETSDEEAAF